MPDPLTPERENARLWQALERIAWHELSGLEARDVARAVLDDAETENERLREELVENEAVWKAWRRRAGKAEAERGRYRVALESIIGRDNENRRLWEGPVPRWTDQELALSGDPCYGNYDDAHSHGADYGMAQAADIARAALARGDAPDA